MTTSKVIVQIHERNTVVQMDADIQPRELGFVSNTNVIRFNENNGTNHNVWMQDSSAPVFDNLLIVTAGLTANGLITANGGLTLGDGDDLIGSSTSDINIDSKFTVAGATGNTLVSGTLAIGGSPISNISLTVHGEIDVGLNVGVSVVSSGFINLRLGNLRATPSNVTDCFIGANDTGGPGGSAGDLILMSRSNNASSIRLFTGVTSPTERVTILNSGDVGINDTNPTFKLDVNGTFRAVDAVTLDSTLGVAGLIAANGGLTLASGEDLIGSATSDMTLSSLNASQAIFTDVGQKFVSNALTGAGLVVMSVSPTITGTLVTTAITASGLITANAGIKLGDNDNITLGDGNDATIDYDGTDLIIDPKVIGSGDIHLLSDVLISGTDVLHFNAKTGAGRIDHDGTDLNIKNEAAGDVVFSIGTVENYNFLINGVSKFKIDGNISKITTSHTFESTATIATTTSFVNTSDVGGLTLGSGTDAKIHYDGTNLIINPRNVGSGDVVIDAGSLVIDNTGEGIVIEGGLATDMIGRATLSGGTKVTLNTNITANDRIFLTRSTTGGTLGHLSTAISAGVSFTINSSSGSETSVIDYLIVRQK